MLLKTRIGHTLLAFFISVVSVSELSAQSAGSKIWYFGINAGVDFTTNPPSALTNGQVYTDEGCAAVSDANGKLFFYTDGRTVYNRNHTTMSNGSGLNGDPSSTQSAVAVGDPGNAARYYLFTVDAFAGAKGLCYSIIDMSKDAGLGQVTTKNINLKTPVSEKITAVRRANSTGVWVITRGWNNDSFHIFLLDSSGCKFYNSQSIGTVISGGTSNSAGYLKCNIQGTKIAYATYQGFVELFDFDPVNATFSNTIKFGGLGNAYGVEFSKSGKLLYFGSSTSKKISQVDLEAGSPADILASQTTVASISGNAVYALQMGPDEKIYMAVVSSDYLSSIPYPETKGTGCGYVVKAIDLNGKLCRAGLPNALNSDNFLPYTQFTWKADCANEPVIFDDTLDYKYDSIRWYFGIKGSSYLGSSGQNNPEFTFPRSDTFKVKLVAWIKSVRVDSVTKEVIVPPVNRDTVFHILCSGDSLKIGGVFYKNSLSVMDTLVSYKSCDSIVLHEITAIPVSRTSVIAYECPDVSYNFFGNSISTPGIYEHTLQNHYGCDSIIELDFRHFNTGYFSFYDTICSEDNYDFFGNTLTQSGVYTEHLVNYEGCDSSVVLYLTRLPKKTHQFTDTFCLKDTYNFFGNLLNKPGTYTHSLQSVSGCDSTVVLNLEIRLCYPVVPCILEFPNAFTPDGNSINDAFGPVVSCNITEYIFRIYNRWGEMVFFSEDPTAKWDGNFKGNPVTEGVYIYRADLTAQQSLEPEKHHLEGTFHLMK